MTNPSFFSLIRLVPLLAILSLVAAQDPTAAVDPAAATDVARAPQINLVPLPTESTIGETVTCLADKFQIVIKGKAPKDLKEAAERLMKRLRTSKMRYLSPTYGAEFFPNGSQCEHNVERLEIIVADQENDIAAYVTKTVEERAASEAYKLSVPVDGVAKITADTALGAFRGITSFENLFYTVDRKKAVDSDLCGLPEDTVIGGRHRRGDISYAPFAPYEIDDKPAFGWRSVLLDTSRHYFSVPALERMIDGLSKVKLSVFHWHITDSQSWPLELSSLPELAASGSYGGRTYSEDDVKHIVAYAAARGLDVVMEIDTPGHTDSIYHSHPEYIACHEFIPYESYAAEPPAGQLRFADDEVTEFAGKIFEAAIPLTSSSYFGTGGDEINANCMLTDPKTNETLTAKNWTLDDALREFTIKTHKVLHDNQRSAVVWEEMALNHGDSGIGNDTIVQVWTGPEKVREVADKGLRLIHAANQYFYLDCGLGGWVPGVPHSWCNPYKGWQVMFEFDPYFNLTESEHELVVGGQASLWAEQTDETNFENVIFPRAAAFAEIFWSGSSNAPNNTYPRDVFEAMPRLHDIRYRLVDQGIRAVPLQPEWCALRPHQCDYHTSLSAFPAPPPPPTCEKEEPVVEEPKEEDPKEEEPKDEEPKDKEPEEKEPTEEPTEE